MLSYATASRELSLLLSDVNHMFIYNHISSAASKNVSEEQDFFKDKTQ